MSPHEDMQERRTLVYNLLDALPKDRMIQLRYVGYKRQLFDSIPVTAAEAYSGSPKSRISHHNDCFASSSNDVGSYHNIQYDKHYLEQDSKYTSIGGETCAWYEPRSNCDTSTYEMERFHWSFINIDYFGKTISNWKAGNCFTEMQKRLGYRFFLTDSRLQDTTRRGSSATVSFTLENYGYSNPMNPRAVEVVIRNRETGKLYYYPVDIDVRKYELNTSIDVTAEIGIPPFVPDGAYDVYLNLPDPRLTIKNNPDFSVRLANTNVWNGSLGMNSLHHVLYVSDHSSFRKPYTGNDYFINDESQEHDVTHILIDGNPADWKMTDTAGAAPSNAMLKVVRMQNNADTLFFLLQGSTLNPNTQILIDADHNGSTGMNYYSWSDDDGIDYLIQNNEIYKYAGANGSSDWTWNLVSGQLPFAGNDSTVEIAVPVRFFGPSGLNDEIRVGALTVSADWSTNEPLPPAGENMINYSVMPFLRTPALYLTSWCNNTILSFAPEEQDSTAQFVIEKSTGSQKSFAPVAVYSGLSPINYFRDNDLEPNSTVSYRIYRVKDAINSAYSGIVSRAGGRQLPLQVSHDPDRWQ